MSRNADDEDQNKSRIRCRIQVAKWCSAYLEFIKKKNVFGPQPVKDAYEKRIKWFMDEFEKLETMSDTEWASFATIKGEDAQARFSRIFQLMMDAEKFTVVDVVSPAIVEFTEKLKRLDEAASRERKRRDDFEKEFLTVEDITNVYNSKNSDHMFGFILKKMTQRGVRRSTENIRSLFDYVSDDLSRSPQQSEANLAGQKNPPISRDSKAETVENSMRHWWMFKNSVQEVPEFKNSHMMETLAELEKKLVVPLERLRRNRPVTKF